MMLQASEFTLWLHQTSYKNKNIKTKKLFRLIKYQISEQFFSIFSSSITKAGIFSLEINSGAFEAICMQISFVKVSSEFLAFCFQ